MFHRWHALDPSIVPSAEASEINGSPSSFPHSGLRNRVACIRAGCNIFPSALGLCERASVQVLVKSALLPLFASVRAPFPHGCKKCKKCPFYRGLHACTLANADPGRENRFGHGRMPEITVAITLGCAYRTSTECWVVLAEDEVIERGDIAPAGAQTIAGRVSRHNIRPTTQQHRRRNPK